MVERLNRIKAVKQHRNNMDMKNAESLAFQTISVCGGEGGIRTPRRVNDLCSSGAPLRPA